MQVKIQVCKTYGYLNLVAKSQDLCSIDACPLPLVATNWFTMLIFKMIAISSDNVVTISLKYSSHGVSDVKTENNIAISAITYQTLRGKIMLSLSKALTDEPIYYGSLSPGTCGFASTESGSQRNFGSPLSKDSTSYFNQKLPKLDLYCRARKPEKRNQSHSCQTAPNSFMPSEYDCYYIRNRLRAQWN